VLCNNPSSPEGSLRFTLTPGGGMERVAGTHQRGSYGLVIRAQLGVRPKGGQRSLREISAELAQRGIMNERGVPFSAASINSMLL